jgi:hypothetical protein
MIFSGTVASEKSPSAWAILVKKVFLDCFATIIANSLDFPYLKGIALFLPLYDFFDR